VRAAASLEAAYQRANRLLRHALRHLIQLRRKNRVYRTELARMQAAAFNLRRAILHTVGHKELKRVFEQQAEYMGRLRAMHNLTDWRGYFIREVFAEGFQRAWNLQNEIRAKAAGGGAGLIGLDGQPLVDHSAPVQLPLEVMQGSFGQSRAATLLLEVTTRWVDATHMDWDGAPLGAALPPALTLHEQEELDATMRDLIADALERGDSPGAPPA
jgi:hypothetical protein